MVVPAGCACKTQSETIFSYDAGPKQSILSQNYPEPKLAVPLQRAAMS